MNHCCDDECARTLAHKVAKAASITLTGAGMQTLDCSPRVRAAVCTVSGEYGATANISRIDQQCDREAAGTSSCSRCKLLGRQRLYEEVDTPVTLLPGRVRLATKPELDWVIGTARKTIGMVSSSRHGCRRRQQRFTTRDHGHLPPEQVSCQCWQAIVLAIGPAIFNRDVLVYDIAGFIQALEKTMHGDTRSTSG